MHHQDPLPHGLVVVLNLRAQLQNLAQGQTVALREAQLEVVAEVVADHPVQDSFQQHLVVATAMWGKSLVVQVVHLQHHRILAKESADLRQKREKFLHS